MKVAAISPADVAQTAATTAKNDRSTAQFGQMVADQLQEINRTQLESDQAIEGLATGQTDDLQGVVLSLAKADLTFRLVLEIRNRLIESYQEIMRMQV